MGYAPEDARVEIPVESRENPIVITTHAETPVFCRQPQNALDAPSDDYRPYHDRVIPGGQEHHRGKEGEAQAHDDRKLCSDLPDGVELDQCAKSGNEHRGLNQARRIGRGEGLSVEEGNTRYQYDGRDVGNKHGQHVLKAEGYGFQDRDPAVQGVDVCDIRIGVIH